LEVGIRIAQFVIGKISEYMVIFSIKELLSKEDIKSICRGLIHQSEERGKNLLYEWTCKQLAILWTKVILHVHREIGMEAYKEIKKSEYYETILEHKEILISTIEYLLSSIDNKRRKLLMQLLHLNTAVQSYNP